MSKQRVHIQPYSTSTTETSQGDVGPRVFTEEEFDKMKTGVASTLDPLGDTGDIGLVVGAMGDWELFDYSGKSVRGTKERQLGGSGSIVHIVRIGDTIRTGSNGRVRVEMADRDPRHPEPSRLCASVDSEMSFSSFRNPDGSLAGLGVGTSKTMIEHVKGLVRVIFSGWRGEAALSIRTGVTICGIRGSDVLISYNPEYEIVAAMVNEGLMDVTSTLTDQTVSLTDDQFVLVSGGEFNPILPMTQQDWDEMVAKAGVEDMQSLSAEELERLLQTSQQPIINAEPEQIGDGHGMPVLIIILVVIAAAAIVIGIYLLIKSRRGYRGETPSPADISGTSPGFCSQCGSDISPGSNFCKKCGRRL